MFIFYIPGLMYRTLPLIYIAAGSVTVVKLPGILGTVSGLLLVLAGLLILKWRASNAAEKRAPTTARPLKHHSRRRGSEGQRVVRAYRPTHSSSRRDDAAPASSLRTAEVNETSSVTKQNGGSHGPSAVPGTTRLDRRGNTMDRRSWRSMPRAAFFDSMGVMVIKDRRKTPDRRRGNILVEEL